MCLGLGNMVASTKLLPRLLASLALGIGWPPIPLNFSSKKRKVPSVLLDRLESHSQKIALKMRVPKHIYTLHSLGTSAMSDSNTTSLATIMPSAGLDPIFKCPRASSSDTMCFGYHQGMIFIV